MKQLSVAITVPVFPNIVQTYILSQLATFKKMGINVSIIARKKNIYKQLPPIIREHQLLDDAIYISTEPSKLPGEIISLPFMNATYRDAFLRLLAFRSWSGYERSYRYKALVLARALAYRPFDIIHSHSMFASYNYLFMKDVLSIPLVTTYHGQLPKGVNKLDDYKLKMVLKKGDAFLVNTCFAKEELIGMGCPAETILIIPQGTNLDNFTFQKRKIDPGKRIVLLTIARLSIEKGHQVAIEAIRELAEQFPTLEYHIVGEGPERARLTNLSMDYGLKERVVFHGFKTGEELRKVFSSAHIFVLPSTMETQGVVLQEAQASGIPVIGSRTGGIPDVIRDNDTGLLFSELNHHELANKVHGLILDPDQYNNLSTSGRKDVEQRFDINLICKNLVGIYTDILSG